MHRVFIGVPLSEGLKAEARRWQEAHSGLPLRWTAPHNLHVTLVPPWYSENIAAAASTLAAADIPVRPFPLRFERVSLGPNPRSPRLVWTCGPTPPELLRLKAAAEKIFGAGPEARPYRLHATLGRSSGREGFPLRHLDEPVDWRMTVGEVVLFESVLTRSGAEYSILATRKI